MADIITGPGHQYQVVCTFIFGNAAHQIELPVGSAKTSVRFKFVYQSSTPCVAILNTVLSREAN